MGLDWPHSDNPGLSLHLKAHTLNCTCKVSLTTQGDIFAVPGVSLGGPLLCPQHINQQTSFQYHSPRHGPLCLWLCARDHLCIVSIFISQFLFSLFMIYHFVFIPFFAFSFSSATYFFFPSLLHFFPPPPPFTILFVFLSSNYFWLFRPYFFLLFFPPSNFIFLSLSFEPTWSLFLHGIDPISFFCLPSASLSCPCSHLEPSSACAHIVSRLWLLHPWPGSWHCREHGKWACRQQREAIGAENHSLGLFRSALEHLKSCTQIWHPAVPAKILSGKPWKTKCARSLITHM